MSAPVAVAPEHLQRAYAQLRKPHWPSLEALREAYVYYGTVRARAVALANGQVLPPEPVACAAPVPAPPVRAGPPRADRRRSDGPIPYSSRAAAAGEYLHPDEETS